MRRLFVAWLLTLLATAPLAAQTVTVRATDPSSGANTNVGDATNNAFRVNCVIGCSPVAATQSGTWTVQPGNTANTTAWLVTGTGGVFPATQSGVWNITNITGTITLPTGAATAAKQPALGIAGTASADVITIQGIAGMTAVKVDGSAVTQPVSTKTALTANSPTAATVGVSSAQAVASNSGRKGLLLVNTSTNTISIACGATAVLNSGITLYPGGSYLMSEYTFCTGAINAIASGASSNLAIQEYQ